MRNCIVQGALTEQVCMFNALKKTFKYDPKIGLDATASFNLQASSSLSFSFTSYFLEFSGMR